MIKNHKKIKPVVFRDPVFGDIPVLSKVIIEVINTPEMQRLRQIKQLSGGHYVFPGATHNRFSHCLGVFYVMSFFLKNPFFNLGTILSTKEQQKLQLAALLHDVGHGPFSHVFEHVYRMQGLDTKHEDYSLLLITNHKSQIYQTLKRHRFTSQDIQDIGNYISNNHSSVLGNLISSQIDADRIDYLMRDNLYTGVGYGYTDLEFLVRNWNFDQHQQKFYFNNRAVYALENYLIGRYHMYQQVYHHPLVRGFEVLFCQWYKRLVFLLKRNFAFKHQEQIQALRFLFQQNPITYENFMRLNDSLLETLFAAMSEEDDDVLRILSLGFQTRTFFRLVSASDLPTIKANLKKRYGSKTGTWFLSYLASPKTKIYHKDKTPIYIKTQTGDYVDLAEYSTLIRDSSLVATEEQNNFYLLDGVLTTDKKH